MAYKFFPQTEADIQEMLARIGVNTLDDLYSDVPECIRFRKEYNLPEAKSELEVRELFARLAALPALAFTTTTLLLLYQASWSVRSFSLLTLLTKPKSHKALCTTSLNSNQ